MSASAHQLLAAVLSPNDTWMVLLEGRPVAYCKQETVAMRVAELLERHGLADVPDTPAAVSPWA